MWTNVPPEAEGYYWYRNAADEPPQVLELEGGVWWAIGADWGVLPDRMPGVWWTERIVEPV